MKIVLCGCAWIAGAGLLAAANAGEVPTLSDSVAPFSFAVLGDTHYSRPAYEARRIAAGIAEDIREVRPAVAFICQTGDFGHGEKPGGGGQLGRDEMREELAFAVEDLAGQFRRPVFVAVGNHDKHAGGTPYAEVMWPFLSRELGIPVSRNYYAFRHGNSCFVFLDFGDYSDKGTTMDYAAQRRFLEETLAQARATPGIRHIFAFGHFPLWPVARPGFRSARFTDSVVPGLREHRVDAYFCGHTHNTGAWVRRVDGVPVTQIQGVAMDASASLQPMEEVRTPLIPPGDLSYGWGCLSGPTNGFFLVSVDGDRVSVQLRSRGTVLRAFEWRNPGEIVDTAKPAPHRSAPVMSRLFRTRPAPVTEDDLRNATAATLVFTPWAEEPTDVNILLNDVRIASTQIRPMPRWAAFGSEMRIAIPAEMRTGLRRANEIVIENPGKSVFGIGNVRLDVTLADGTVARTSVSDRYLFSAGRAEAESARKATFGWEILPAEVIATVRLGEPLGPVRLSFPGDPK